MKILFTIDSLQQGGAEQSIAHIIAHFAKDTQVALLYFYSKHDLLPVYESLGCDIHFLNLQGKYDWKNGIEGMSALLQQIQPDIVVTSLYRSNIISRVACKRNDIKLVGTFVDDSYNVERRKTFKGLGLIKYYATWLLDRLTSSIPIAWIANSQSIAINNAHQLGISSKKINVIYRGRDSSLFSIWEKPAVDCFTFICIGRLYEKKGYPELVEAFAKVVAVHPNAKLIIYGEGGFRKSLEQMISSMHLESHIHLAGNVSKAWLKLYEGNCFVFPSRFEGFSGALVEAMMTGIPIISSDIPMNLEAVTSNETALVHQLKNAVDLANKMLEMISNYTDMIEMGKRARAVAIEKFEIKTIAKQYESVLLEIASGR